MQWLALINMTRQASRTVAWMHPNFSQQHQISSLFLSISSWFYFKPVPASTALEIHSVATAPCLFWTIPVYTRPTSWGRFPQYQLKRYVAPDTDSQPPGSVFWRANRNPWSHPFLDGINQESCSAAAKTVRSPDKCQQKRQWQPRRCSYHRSRKAGTGWLRCRFWWFSSTLALWASSWLAHLLPLVWCNGRKLSWRPSRGSHILDARYPVLAPLFWAWQEVYEEAF